MLMTGGNVQGYVYYVLEYAEYEVKPYHSKALNSMVQKGLSMYLKTYLSTKSILSKRLRG